MNNSRTEEQLWAAVAARDASAAGQFVFGVASTGIYCRPGCPARMPKKENVSYFKTPAQAEAAGFRPCLRCKPDKPLADSGPDRRILAACRTISEDEQSPNLDELARAAGLSKHHFQRLFKATLGLTPAQYGRALRLERVGQALRSGLAVTEAVYAAGYGSASRFYEGVTDKMGMSPSSIKSGGSGQLIHYALARGYLGQTMVAATDKGICFIGLDEDDQKLLTDLKRRFPKAEIKAGRPEFQAWVAEVVAGLTEPARAAALPLDLHGTAFQHRVWRALREIPPGTTTTYSQLAAKLGNPKAARAVARANATNPVSVAVPCHRVIRADGSLGGYYWGLDRKKALLQAEAQGGEE